MIHVPATFTDVIDPNVATDERSGVHIHKPAFATLDRPSLPLIEQRAAVFKESGEARPEYLLKPGVSFCRVAGNTIFLDLSADRYFCLSPPAERSFSKLVAGEPLSGSDTTVLDILAVKGPLTRQEYGYPIKPCPAIELPGHSLVDENAARPGQIEILAAAFSLIAAPLRLRTCGLRVLVEQLRSRKAGAIVVAGRRKQVAVAAAFAALRFVATEQDNCLIRSIAVAGRLIGVGANPDLILGVKLRPFAAHAWVQSHGCMVNDRHEFVRDYTPILIV